MVFFFSVGGGGGGFGPTVVNKKGRIYKLIATTKYVNNMELSFMNIAIMATSIIKRAWPAKTREPFSAAYLLRTSTISFFPFGIILNGA